MNDGNHRPRAKRSRRVSPPPPTLVDFSNLEAIIVNVERFLGIEETSNLSKTCRTIRHILVHPNGVFPKIKVSHFEVVDATAPDGSVADVVLPPPPPHCRISNFTSIALANIHFPTLERLEIKFPRGKIHRTSDPEHELRDSFIYLALGLERAVNLEKLILDFTPFLTEKSNFLSQNNINTLSENLCRCTKLKRLEIVNRFEEQHQGGEKSSIYSTALLAAFIPAIERGVSTLESVSFVFGEEPTTLSSGSSFYSADNTSTRSSSSVGNDIISQSRDLFRNILLCNKLKELSLSFSCRRVHSSLLNSFLRVCRDIHSEREGKLPSSSIEKLTLKCVGDNDDNNSGIKLMPKGQLSIAPLMDMLSKQPNLDMSTISVDDC